MLNCIISSLYCGTDIMFVVLSNSDESSHISIDKVIWTIGFKLRSKFNKRINRFTYEYMLRESDWLSSYDWIDRSKSAVYFYIFNINRYLQVDKYHIYKYIHDICQIDISFMNILC